MHKYMHHVTSQQAANQQGQWQLNESFYRYKLHQQSQNPSHIHHTTYFMDLVPNNTYFGHQQSTRI